VINLFGQLVMAVHLYLVGVPTLYHMSHVMRKSHHKKVIVKDMSKGG
jgi:hypothetical protein